jgi:CheY-like chemotaxis protein
VLPSSGEAGLILAQTGRPDRILTDNSMPDIMGLEVVQRLKNDPATRRIPVVAY